MLDARKANMNTNVVYHADAKGIAGKVVRVMPDGITCLAHFPTVGFIKTHYKLLTVVHNKFLPAEIGTKSSCVSEAIDNQGADKLAAFARGKNNRAARRKLKQVEYADKQRSKTKTAPKSPSQKAAKIAKIECETERNYQSRIHLAGFTMNGKKGEKVKVNASEVQKDM